MRMKAIAGTIRVVTDGRVRQVDVPVSIRRTASVRVEPGNLIALTSEQLRRGATVQVRFVSASSEALDVTGVSFVRGTHAADTIEFGPPRVTRSGVELDIRVAPRDPGVTRMTYRVDFAKVVEPGVELTILGFSR